MNSNRIPLVVGTVSILVSGYFFYQMHSPPAERATVNPKREALAPIPKTTVKPKRKAVAVDPKKAEALYNEALHLRGESKIKEAVAKLSEAIDYNPDYFDAYLNRATLNAMYIGDGEAVLQDANELLRLKPNYAPAYNLRSGGLIAEGRFPAAITEINKAISLEPSNWIFYNTRASVYNDMGKYEEAIRDFTKAVDLEPREIMARSNRASVYAFVGQYDSARADLDEIARMVPSLKSQVEAMKKQYNIPPK